MKTAIIQHQPSVTAGTTIDWLKQNQFEFIIYKVFEKEEFPAIDDFDLLVICGGTMNVDQAEQFPWLTPEKKLIHNSILNQKKIIGLCLGGQLTAEALGAKVGPHHLSEIGWQPVRLLPNQVLSFEESVIHVFQFHSYAFETPANAVRIATNEACTNQAFTMGSNILCFQFHPETTLAWATKCANEELPTGVYCQTQNEILADNKFQAPLQRWYFNILDQFIRQNSLV